MAIDDVEDVERIQGIASVANALHRVADALETDGQAVDRSRYVGTLLVH